MFRESDSRTGTISIQSSLLWNNLPDAVLRYKQLV